MKRILYWTSGVLMMLLGISLLYPELTAQVLAHAAPDTSLYANWLATHVMGTGVDGVAMASAALLALPVGEQRQKLGELWEQQKAILDAADTEKRGLSAEERSKYDAIEADLDALDQAVNAATEAEQRKAKHAQRGAKLQELQSRGIRPESREERGKQTPSEGQMLARILPPSVRSRMARDGREHEIRAIEHRSSTEYRDAFYGYLMGGKADLTPEEKRALSVGTAVEGGNTVPIEQFFPELIKAADDRAVLRTIARVLPPVAQAQGLGVPTLSADPADADWTTELGTGSEDTAMQFGKRELHPWPVAKRIKASDKLLRSSPMMVDSLVRDRLGYKLGVTHSKAFNTGTGANQPLGIYTASADGIPTTRDVEIGSGAGAVDPDKVIDARFTLKEGYYPRARWHFHRNWLARFRKLKGSDNNYLWQPGLTNGAPSTFLDFPYSLDEYAPSVTTHGAGVYAAVLGDFDFYWIVDALSMRIQRLEELYAESNQVGFIIRAESDGMPVLSEAFVRLIAAT